MPNFHGRSLDRLQALQALFQAEAARRSVSAVLAGEYLVTDEAGRENLVTSGPIRPYARELALGVEAEGARIDALIARHSTGWDLSRITPVDRNLLRVALYELIFEDDVNTAVAANEAVELAKALGGDDSHRFVNGILGAVARSGEAEGAGEAADADADAEAAAASGEWDCEGEEDDG